MAINYSPSLLPSPVRQLRPSQTRSSPPNPPALRLSPFFFLKKNIFAFFIFCLCISVLVFCIPNQGKQVPTSLLCLHLIARSLSEILNKPKTFFWDWDFFSETEFSQTFTKVFFRIKYRNYFPGEHFQKRIPRLFSEVRKLGNFCLSWTTYLTAFHDFWQQVWVLSRHDHQPESHQSSFNTMSESVSYKQGQAMHDYWLNSGPISITMTGRAHKR